MATYFSGSSNQKDLYSKEHLPSTYSEAQLLPGNVMMYMNYPPPSSGSYSEALASGNSQQHQGEGDGNGGGVNGISPVTESDSNPSQQEIFSNLGGSRMGGLHGFSEWKSGRDHEMVLMQPQGSADDVVLQGPAAQGLSLSLGTHVSPGFQLSSIQYRAPNMEFSSFLGPSQLFPGEDGSGALAREGSFGDQDDYPSKQSRNAEYAPPGFPPPGGGSLDPKAYLSSPYGVSSIARTLSNSKYLKAAQQLLDEVVNVRAALRERSSSKTELNKGRRETDGASKDGSPEPPPSSNPQESNSNTQNELSTTEKQELQNKLGKLLSMLDEVDSRYKQYYHQMQIVVSTFDMVAGSGAAKPYTAVALQTISRHFRCLRDAINGQILATRKSLGEQDASSNSKGVGISRLRYVDQQLRQQRALQQLGVMQQHAWRPQRGLPENAVTVLRAWLFEHFLHPYPKDSDKIMLARQTGLTRSQVSNWFINARVRLWKPMVEEMYKEEIGDAEMDSISSAEGLSRATKSDTKVSEDRGEDIQQSSTSTAIEQCVSGQFFESRPDHRRDAETGILNSNASFQNITQEETRTDYELGKTREDLRPTLDVCPVFPDIGHSNRSSDRFMAAAATKYHISEHERFGHGNGVSLTLGLQQCDGASLPMPLAAAHHSFITLRGDDVYNAAPSSMGPETADFECMDTGNRQHRFGSSHLLHDFVA